MMEIIKDKKIAYWCKTKEDANHFFEEARKKEFRVQPNQAEMTWLFEQENTCYVYNSEFSMFGFNNKTILEEQGYKIIEYIPETKTTEERLKYLENEISKLTENMKLIMKIIKTSLENPLF